MGIFDQLSKSKGGYIFLSHSHDDIERVRKIRNTLEQNGFEPLCFYLKCLNDDSEIEDLIKREIDAREWFVFADSENARNSRWVTMEREYIQRTDSKKIITVDINDEQAVSRALDKLTHNLRIFLSYSYKDTTVAHRIMSKLIEKDYLVYSSDNCSSVKDRDEYVYSIFSMIEEAAQDGCVISLITPNSIRSRWKRDEILYAINYTYEYGGNVIPVSLGNVKLPIPLRRKNGFCLSEDPSDEELDAMIEAISQRLIEEI